MNFKDLDINELLSLVNHYLEDGLSLIKISQILGVNESSIRKKLNKAGYKRVGNKFVLQSGGHAVLNKENTEVEVVRDIDVLHKEDSVVPNELKENLKNLMSNYNVLMEMIESYKNNGVVQGGDIVVQLPKERNTLFKTSVRLNDVVYEEFKEFCSKHKTFTQKELHSMALLEYIKKYDK